MNIFYTHSLPERTAIEHCFIHQNKMLIESIQLLSTAHHILDGESAPKEIAKACYRQHPCTIWVRGSLCHYLWLLRLANSLSTAFCDRTGRVHKATDRLSYLQEPPKNLLDNGWVDPPMCMPDVFKGYDGTAASYHRYLNSKFSEWRARRKPLKVEFLTEPKWLRIV